MTEEAYISEDEGQHDQFKDVRRLTDRESAFAHPEFEAGVHNFESVQKCRILIVGAGGLGCEILKNLALMGFKKIDIIDMDTIDLSNLNRQFLFRNADIGKYKAETAANFVNKRVNGVEVTAHNVPIQDKPLDFYRQFGMIICGLDSITARRWLNTTMVNLVDVDSSGEPDFSTMVPLIDGGTEGFKGNARVILPYLTPCVECTLDLYPPQVNFPLCTIAHTPRLPEHCVEYVKVIQWDEVKPFGEEAIDGDNPEHLEWITAKAMERAEKYGIRGVDFRLTQGVVKRIIPAVASTNAVIAGACAIEAFKLASNTAISLNNYLNFSDIDGAFYGSVTLERNPSCIVCSQSRLAIEAAPSDTFEAFLTTIKDRFQLKSPSVRSAETVLYMINDLLPEITESSKLNLTKSLKELNLADGDELHINDESLKGITLRVAYPN
uniref:NEDD8-activating enzyme E1 catalytic subunit n=1 Tax=Panagrellus redivivus TaxID=6233 RepID=A0A7E4UUT1_PANRE